MLTGMVVASRGSMPVSASWKAFVRSKRSIACVALSCLLTVAGGCSTVPERRPDSAEAGQGTGGAAGGNDGGFGGDVALEESGSPAGGEASGGSPGTGG